MQCTAQMHEAATPMRSRVFAFVRVKVLKDSFPDDSFWRRPLSGEGQEYAFPAGSQPYIQAAAVFLQKGKSGERARYIVGLTACENFSLNGLSRRISGALEKQISHKMERG